MMTTFNDILITANDRAKTKQLPYAGAVTPAEAYALVREDSRVKIIDVRTKAERDWVGTITIPAEQHFSVEWSLYPGGTPNPDFIDQLQRIAAKEDILLFLCRSGVRSRHAAKLATDNGFTQCHDILEGFEGDKDTQGHRKMISGWCKAGLPWMGA